MGGFRVHSSVEPRNWQCLTNSQSCMLQNIYNGRKCGYSTAADINKTGSPVGGSRGSRREVL